MQATKDAHEPDTVPLAKSSVNADGGPDGMLVIALGPTGCTDPGPTGGVYWASAAPPPSSMIAIKDSIRVMQILSGWTWQRCISGCRPD
jgi:hypothetical protein